MNEWDKWGNVYDTDSVSEMIDAYTGIIKKYDTVSKKIYARGAVAAGNVPDDDEEAPTREDRMFENFAKEAMHELDACGKADFVLLRNDKLRKWWQAVKKQELEAQIKREAIARKKMLKEQGLAKLSDEEKEALGLTKKK